MSNALTKFACAFTVTYAAWGDNGMKRKVCRYECDSCFATIDFPVSNNSFVKAVDVHRKWLNQRSWRLNGHADRATCPACQSKPKTAVVPVIVPAPEMKELSVVKKPITEGIWPTTPAAAPVKKKMGRPRKVPLPLPDLAAAAEEGEEHHQRQVAYLPDHRETAPRAEELLAVTVQDALQETKQETIAPTVAVASTKRPTSEQLLKIRTALDNHYDDSTGEYLAGHDDGTIADSLGITRAWVATIREVAYGPLRTPREELALVRETITSLQRQLVDAVARLDKLEAADGPRTCSHHSV